jgi:hypothetical protein
MRLTAQPTSPAADNHGQVPSEAQGLAALWLELAGGERLRRRALTLLGLTDDDLTLSAQAGPSVRP